MYLKGNFALKKIYAFCLIICSFFIFTACSKSKNNTGVSIGESEINRLENVSMKTEKESYPKHVIEIDIIIENNTDYELNFGEVFYVQVFKDNKWDTISFAKDKDGFIEIANIIPPHDKAKSKVDLSRLDYTIVKGKYRIIKEINNPNSGSSKLSAEFMIE